MALCLWLCVLVEKWLVVEFKHLLEGSFFGLTVEVGRKGLTFCLEAGRCCSLLRQEAGTL